MFMNSGTDNPTYRFVISIEDLSFFPMIESVFPKFIRDIICFSP